MHSGPEEPPHVTPSHYIGFFFPPPPVEGGEGCEGGAAGEGEGNGEGGCHLQLVVLQDEVIHPRLERGDPGV